MVTKRVKLVRACELRVAGQVYRMGDVLVLTEDQAALYVVAGYVEQLEDEGVANLPPQETAPDQAPKKTRTKKT